MGVRQFIFLGWLLWDGLAQSRFSEYSCRLPLESKLCVLRLLSSH
jgi:hypothetical protein